TGRTTPRHSGASIPDSARSCEHRSVSPDRLFPTMKALAFGLVLLTLPHAPRAQPVNYDLLVGSWSEPGQCEVSLRLFTGDGRYVWLERPDEDAEWSLAYAGVYVPWSAEEARAAGVRGAIVIAEGLDMGGFVLVLKSLSEGSLTLSERGSEGETGGAGETTTWVRCPLQ